MSDALLEAFRHNSWATKELLAFCSGLSSEQLETSAAGSYGSILATFNHVVSGEAGYLSRFLDEPIPWRGEEDADLPTLQERNDELTRGWERVLAQPVDADRLFLLDEGAYEARASVIIVQALHHANVHREQICMILTGLGLQPPELGSWEHGEATGRARELNA